MTTHTLEAEAEEGLNPRAALASLLDQLIGQTSKLLGLDGADVATVIAGDLATRALVATDYDADKARELVHKTVDTALDLLIADLANCVAAADKQGVAVPDSARRAAQRTQGVLDG
jgi:hypothetical protein